MTLVPVGLCYASYVYCVCVCVLCDCGSDLTLERMNLEKQLADMQKRLREADEQRRLGFWPSSAHASLFSSYAPSLGPSASTTAMGTTTETGMNMSSLMYGQLPPFGTGDSPYLFPSSSATTATAPETDTITNNGDDAEGDDDDDDDDDENEEEHALMSEELLRTLLLSHPVKDGEDDNDSGSHTGT